MLRLLTSFDGTESQACDVYRPDRYGQLFNYLSNKPKFLARGAGLSYCGASLSQDGAVILSESFNRFLGYNPAERTFLVEAGMQLGKLLDFSLQCGCFPPVLPGHPSISVGGAVAFNVHGKSQVDQGCFEDCVERLWLFHPSYGEIECENPRRLNARHSDIFALTVGGMGLTGFITKVELKLVPLLGTAIERRRIKVRNLEHAVETMTDLHSQYPILYSWNNMNHRGSRLGSGVVYAERFTKGASISSQPFNTLRPPTRRTRPLPLLNNLTAPLMCEIYGLGEALGAETQVLPVRPATFPINGKEFYFGLFGAPGLREYQMILPRDSWTQAVGEVADAVKKSGCGVSLGSLKLFKGTTRYLGFCGDGVCLALDVPARPHSLRLFEMLDRVVTKHHGIINLSKDSRASAKLAESVFPEYRKFRAELEGFDKDRRCTSILRDRLGL